jgi:ADP-heptose:LPS heptosyltransferase
MGSILLLQLKRLGDLILSTAAFSALRKLFPEARITLLIDDYSRELLPAISSVDEVWTYDRKNSLNLWARLIPREFDLCLDFTGNDRSALIAFLSKASRRIGFTFLAKRAIRSWVYTDLVPSPVRERHTVDHYLDLVRSLGKLEPEPAPWLSIPPSVLTSAHLLRKELSMQEHYFVVHPGTARPEKYWPAERWCVVIKYVWEALKIPCLLTGGNNPQELKHVRDIQNALGASFQSFSLAGRIDFLMTTAMISQTQLFLGVDTAAAHVAALFQRPALVLFGPTNPFHWSPRHRSGRVVRAGFGYPYEANQPREQGHPMSELSTETVIHAMEDLLRVFE